MRIVYYAHHHGTGHLVHARRFARLGIADVTIVGPRGADIELPSDTAGAERHREPPHSPFHWTPSTPAIRARFDAFHQALLQVSPDLVLVDVSVEAAVFAHLAGFRVAHRRMPGDRSDRAHHLAYATSRGLFAYFPAQIEDPDFAYAARTTYLGMPADRGPLPASAIEPGAVVVLSGAGGQGPAWEALVEAASTTPDRSWHVLGPVVRGRVPAPANLVIHGWVADPTPFLARAEQVVCGAGHNTIATVAAVRRAAVVAPEPRPHDEQLAFARRLGEAYGVPVVEDWQAADWATVLEHPGDPDALADLLVDRVAFTARVQEMLRDLA